MIFSNNLNDFLKQIKNNTDIKNNISIKKISENTKNINDSSAVKPVDDKYDENDFYNGTIQISSNNSSKSNNVATNLNNLLKKINSAKNVKTQVINNNNSDKTSDSKIDKNTQNTQYLNTINNFIKQHTNSRITPTIQVEPTISTEPINSTIPRIADGEVGSKSYISRILGFEINDNYDTQTDVFGRITTVSKIIGYGNGVSIKNLQYTISYNNNNEATVSEVSNLTTDGTSPGTKTFNSSGELIKETLPYTVVQNPVITTIYYENGEQVGTSTLTYETRADGTQIKTENTTKVDGSWDKTVTDEKGNVILKEGKAVLKAYPELIMTYYGGNPIPEGTSFGLNGMSIVNKNNQQAEITYSVNSDGETVVNGNNLEIFPYTYIYYPASSSIYGFASMPYWAKSNETAYDNLTIKGDNNIITGSKENDNITVKGNNNKIDLKEGDDVATVYGENEVSNTEKVISKTFVPEIQDGEVGSLSYVSE